MGGTRCAISTCNNTYTKAKKEGSLLSLHSFPRDSHLRERWKAVCRREDKWNPRSSHICSNHFHPDDFEADQRLQLWTGIKWKPKLKPGAVPTVNLPGPDVPTTSFWATEILVSSEAPENCDGNRRYKKPPKKSARTKTDVIYSCAEFELYVT